MTETKKRLRRDAWVPSWIKYLRRQILKENVSAFSAHWCSEDGLAFSPRTVEAWEQGRRTPPLFVRLAMTRNVVRLRKLGHIINLPDE